MISALMCLATVAPQKLVIRDGALVDQRGKKVILRGCNLGNWLVTENWMWDQNQPEGGPSDQYSIEKVFTERFGEKEKDRLMEVHRRNWIKDRDFAIIKSFRFNCVRLPMNYRALEADENPYQLKKNAWKWIDKTIELAKKHDLYVILDMHGAQGGQSPYDHTGRVGQNKIWTDPEAPKRLTWLWKKIAARYKDEPTVVAYDLFNEPYGGELEQIRKLFAQVYPEVRKVDPEKLIWAHGRYDTFAMYEPDRKDWKNVGVQMHYYPGLFGGGSPTVRTHLAHHESLAKNVAPVIKEWNVPFLIGEMNVVFDRAGGANMMRRTYDLHESFGWHTTMWSYKVLRQPGGLGDSRWGMVMNAKPFKPIDFRKSPKADIEKFFKWQGTMKYSVFEDLRKVMVPKKVDLPPFPEVVRRTTAPQEQLASWTRNTIGGALTGGLQNHADGFTLFGGGADIWGVTDQFEFLSNPVSGDFTIQVEISSLEDIHSYAKAGLMLRSTMDGNSAHVLASVFPGGEIQVAHRPTPGADTKASDGFPSSFPVKLQMSRKGNTVTVRRWSSNDWVQVYEVELDPSFGKIANVGVVALSHDDAELVGAKYRNLTIYPEG